MHKTKEDIVRLCEMRKSIEEYTCALMKCEGQGAPSVEQGRQWIDMIKNLYEAEKDAWKACYYRKMVEGMEPMNPEMLRECMERLDYQGPMGYDNWRYASGRFAPKGHGTRTRSGYMPDPDYDSKYGDAWSQWKRSRKHYTETNNKADKDEMTLHAKEHLNDSINSIRELWKNSDPELRKMIKSNLSSLVGELPA